MSGWLIEHGSDPVPVKLIDLMSVVARMQQVLDTQPAFDDLVHERIFTCDLPRLTAYLPEEARQILDEELAHAEH